MANGFVTDYSFLNLPEMGSAVRGPIELPSFEPVNYLSNIPFVGRRGRQQPETFDLSPLPSDFATISERPGIRDIQGAEQVGAVLGERMAEAEKFYGDQVNQLQGSIQELETAKQGLLVERNDAIEMQDVIRQQLSEEKIQALNEQQARLQSELQQAVAEAEARGVNAVAAAEARAAEKLQQVTSGYEGQINEINQALADVTAERDQAIAEQDVIRAQAADEQAQALESQKQTIADLQSQIAALQAPTPVVSEQPATPLDSYLRDQERIDAAVSMMPGGDAIQQGIEDLYGRVTAGGGKPEDFRIYQPPVEMTLPAPTPSAPPSDGKLYAGGSAGLYGPGGKFYSPRVDLPPPTETGGISGLVQRFKPLPTEPAPKRTTSIGAPISPPRGYTYGPNGQLVQIAKIDPSRPTAPVKPPASIANAILQTRSVSPIVSQPLRTIPTTASRMPVQTRPTLPIRPMGRFAGGGLVDMIQMRLNRIR